MSTKILIIGACGQIGTELTQKLRSIYGNENVIASDIIKLNNDIVNNYFVFLEVDHINLPQNNALYKLNFEGFLDEKENKINEEMYILGIEKERMNKLSLTQPEFIQNLINTL